MKKWVILSVIGLAACTSSEPMLDTIELRQQEKIQSYQQRTVADVASFRNSNHGNWTYINDVTSTTQEVESYAFSRSVVGRNTYGRRLILGVECNGSLGGTFLRKPEIDVYVRVDQVTNSINAYRFNDEAAETNPYHSVWQGFDGVTFSDSESRDFISMALSKNFVYVDMSMYSSSNIEAKFSLAGFGAAFDKVYRDCYIGNP